MTGHKIIWSTLALLFLIEICFVSSSERCYSCNAEKSNCKHHNEECANNQSCFIKKYSNDNGTTLMYQTGCTNTSSCQQLCTMSGNTTTECEVLKCCDDDFCNNLDDLVSNTTWLRVNVFFVFFMSFLVLIKITEE